MIFQASALVLLLATLTGVNSVLVNPRLELPKFCGNENDCFKSDPNSYCNFYSHKCQCAFGFEPFKPFPDMEEVCQVKTCSSDLQCLTTYGANSQCNTIKNRCECEKNYQVTNESQFCIPKQHPFVPIVPIVPVVPVIPPKATVSPIGGACGWNSKTCGSNATCWFSTCMCPVGYKSLNSVNCTKIDCIYDTDCTIYDANSYCKFNPSGPNQCKCNFGVDFNTQKCSRQTFFPTYSNSYYYSYMTSYISFLVVILFITIVITVIRHCRNKPATKKIIKGKFVTPNQQVPPPPPYQTKA